VLLHLALRLRHSMPATIAAIINVLIVIRSLCTFRCALQSAVGIRAKSGFHRKTSALLQCSYTMYSLWSPTRMFTAAFNGDSKLQRTLSAVCKCLGNQELSGGLSKGINTTLPRVKFLVCVRLAVIEPKPPKQDRIPAVFCPSLPICAILIRTRSPVLIRRGACHGRVCPPYQRLSSQRDRRA